MYYSGFSLETEQGVGGEGKLPTVQFFMTQKHRILEKFQAYKQEGLGTGGWQKLRGQVPNKGEH